MRGRAYVRSWERLVADVLVVAGLVGAVWGVAYWVNGMTQAPATVKVQVGVTGADGGSGWGNAQVDVAGVAVPDGWFAGARPVAPYSGADGVLTLAAWDSTVLEQAAARAGGLVAGLGVLVGALALRPVLRGIGEGRPFARGTARRLTVVAVTIGVAGVLASWLPGWAGVLVLHRTGLADTDRFLTAPTLDGTPLLVGLVVLLVAGAFRVGERHAREIETLV